MERLRSVFGMALMVLLVLGCSKDESFITTQDNVEHRLAHHGHTHFASEASTHTDIGYEEYTPAVPLIDHAIYLVLEPILPDKFSTDEIAMLEVGYVWVYQEGGEVVYSIDFEYNAGSIKKLLVTADTEL